MSEDPELEAFKTKFDLRQYAAPQGYTLDRKETWSGSAVMRRQGDKFLHLYRPLSVTPNSEARALLSSCRARRTLKDLAASNF